MSVLRRRSIGIAGTYDNGRHWVDCVGDENCGVSNYFKYHTKAEAIEAWNKRKTSKPLKVVSDMDVMNWLKLLRKSERQNIIFNPLGNDIVPDLTKAIMEIEQLQADLEALKSGRE